MRGHAERVIDMLVVAEIVLLAALLSSCERSYHQETERYIFIASNITVPYWQEAGSGFKDAAAALGVKSDFAGPDSYSPDDELDAFQKALDRHPAGVLIAPARADK